MLTNPKLMPKTIALLRGINVGGHRIIKMADLKKLMNGLGFKKVITYIQSGNILFDSPAKAKYDEIADRIKRGIQTQFGFDVPVVVLDAKKLEEAVAQNPFKDADLSQLHITFLSEEPAVAKQNNIKTPKTVRILHSEDTERVIEELDKKFPVILKTSTGSQTGVGVVIVESMRSLHAAVQMLKLYEKHMPILIQEYIKTDYDVRVVILDDKILGSVGIELNPCFAQKTPKSLKSDLYALSVLLAFELLRFSKVSS